MIINWIIKPPQTLETGFEAIFGSESGFSEFKNFQRVT